MITILLLLLLAAAVAVVTAHFVPGVREWVERKKTLTIASIITILGVLQEANLTDIVGEDQVGYWFLGIGILMALLRLWTKGPVGK